MSEQVRVAIVDDDPLVRTGLRLILGGAPQIEVVGEAQDGDEVADLVAASSPQVILMDIRMPRRDGLTATRELLAQPDPPKVLVLTTFDTDDMVLEALRIGAQGFLLKSTRPEALVDAVLTVAAGSPALSPTVTAKLIASVTQQGSAQASAGPEGSSADSDRTRAARRRLDRLTEREREVAMAVGEGASNAEIARDLFMGIPTVKAHVSRILTKLGAENRTQIAIVVHDARIGDDAAGS